MSRDTKITCHYRPTGTRVHEQPYAAAFLDWAYNTWLGRAVMELVLRRKPVSQLYGWLNRQRWSRRRIEGFARKMNVDLEESLRPIEDFTDFNDFFTREIDLSRRPIHPDPSVCVAPADGRILAYPVVAADTTFRIKGATFHLGRFLRDESLTRTFAGGSMVISRLALSDYHHFHFSDSGIPGRTKALEGNYDAVGPYARRKWVPFYTENHRALTLFESDHFGRMAIVEVGALTVGSIQQRYRPGIWVPKGAGKGYFELGGSTVVILFEPRAIRIDDDLFAHTAQGIETYVRLGDSIGRRFP